MPLGAAAGPVRLTDDRSPCSAPGPAVRGAGRASPTGTLLISGLYGALNLRFRNLRIRSLRCRRLSAPLAGTLRMSPVPLEHP